MRREKLIVKSVESKLKKKFLRHLLHCNHTIPVEQSIFLVQQTLLLTLTLCSTNVCTTLSKPASQAKWRGDIPSQASIPPSPSGPGRRGLENINVRSTLLEIPSKYSKCYWYNKNLAVVSTSSPIVSPVDVLYETRWVRMKKEKGKEKIKNLISPLHPNISMDILHTNLYKFP